MAKRVVDEEMRFSVIINGNEAQAELFKIEKRNRELTQTIKAQRAEKAKLEAQGKKNSQEYKNLTAAISQNNAELKANKTRMGELQKQIGVTGLTMRQLRQRASQLRLQLNNMVPGSAQYKKFQLELQQINTQITKLRGNAAATQSSLSRVANGFNKYAALGATVIATGTGIVLSLQKMIDFNGKLSDAQSNVQKTTGLAKDEVKELTKEFGLMKTRTARIELLELAEEAGRLGIEGKANILQFVNTANKIKLALGDDLSTEQIREVGKIANIYKVGAKNNLDFATSFESVGSAINEVAASGANQASFLVDYLKRTSGIAQQTNVAAEANIGYAATFDEIGQSVEISGTAMNKVFIDMFSNTKEYAKIAGMTEESFGNLLNTDANEAMLRFLEGLNGNNEGFAVMVKRMEEIEAGGARGAQALSAVAANTDLVREKQALANKALKENTSLTAEATLREQNLAAALEKLGRKIRGIFASEAVVTGLTNFVNWLAKFIGASEDADGKVTRFRNNLINFLKTVIVITAAVISYNTAIKLTALFTNNAYKATKLYALVQKVSIVSTNTLKGATLLLSAAYNFVTGNIKKATAAMRLFNTITKLNPLGLLLGAVTAIVTAYVLFSDKAKKAATSQELLNSATAEALKNTAEEVKQKELWLQVATSENASREQKQKAIDELNRTVPEYNNQLTIETANTLEAKAALDKHIEALKQNAIALALQEKIKKKAVELAELENSSLEDNIKWYEELWNVVRSGNDAAGIAARNVKTATENRKESVEATKEEIKALEELYQKQLAQNSPQGGSDGPTGPQEGDIKTVGDKKFIFRNGKWVLLNPYKPTGDPDDSKKAEDALAKEQEKLLNLQRKYEDDRIALIENSFQREMQQNDVTHLRKVEDLKKKASDLLTAFDKAMAEGNQQLASTYLDQYNVVLNQIEQEEVNHQAKRNEILEKGIQDYFTKLQEKHNREELERETAYKNELAALGDNERAKEALTKKFEKDKLERQKTNQQLLMAELNKILDNARFEDFSLDLLSDEQLQAIKDRLAELGLSLAEINALLSHMQGNKAGDELEGLGISGETDLLGLTQDQWIQMFSNTETLAGAIGKIGLALGAAGEAYSIFDQFLRAGEQKKLDRIDRNLQKEKAKTNKLLANKFISQKQHDDAVEALEKQAQKKKAEIQYKQAKREKAINIATILGNQAVAVSKALAQGGFVLGIPWAGIVAALAGIQLAMAIAQPLPAKGFEKGFYNTFPVQREQDGKVFNAGFGGESRSGIVDKPTVFLAGEGGKNFPEMIIDGRTLKQFNPDLKNSLYRELAKIRGFETGYYKPETRDASSSSTFEDTALIATLSRTNELLDNLDKNGVTAYMDKSARTIQKLQEEIKKLEKVQQKIKL